MNADLDNVSLEVKARKNITFFGLDVNSPVFFISSGLAIIFSSYSLNLRTILSAMIIGLGLYLSAFFGKKKSAK